MIAITGSNGFVGKNLCNYLKNQGYRINSISRSELGRVSMNNINGNQAITHLAGKAHDIKKVSQPSEYYEANYELTKNLYNSFLKSDANMFIFISSVKAVADSVEGILTEDYRPDPKTHYGKSKLKAEEYIQSIPLPVNKSYYILRPCMIHGAGNKGNLNLLYKLINKGVPYPLAGFENKRSFLSVENLCFVISELISNDRKLPSGIYNVSDNEVLSTSEVVTILGSAIGKISRLWTINPNIIKFVALIGDKLGLPLNSERLKKLTESYIVSNEKLLHYIDKPLPLSASEGLKITALSFKNS